MLNIAIVGAGAAGLIASIEAAKLGANVSVYEKNERPARKLMITGKGRCNLTNSADKTTLMNSVVRNSKFLYSAFSAFDCHDTYKYFTDLGVNLKIERGGRVFPDSDKAVTIVYALVNEAKAKGVKFIHKKVDSISKDLLINNSDKYDKIIIATGGLSYSLTGSTGDGHKISQSLGHTVTKIRPSLVPLCSNDEWVSSLSGLSLKNVVFSVFKEKNKKAVFSELGEMLFCHFGLSGPLVLSASAHIDFDLSKYFAEIDLKPALSLEKLDARLLREFQEAGKKEVQNIIGKVVPIKLGKVLLNLSAIPYNTKANEITKEMRKNLISNIKALKIRLDSFRPIEEAIITRGGIDIKEINPKTMESKLIKGLYFAGEIIDVDAYTGGFNLQIAFSTGYLAGNNAGIIKE